MQLFGVNFDLRSIERASQVEIGSFAPRLDSRCKLLTIENVKIGKET